ncbi:glycoside hydrolase family 76 protein [Xylariaceae sp. FL0804]|nr:glycoside hydrolase family 76 protein [Xylariaceae sp. FL0804]
MTRGGSLLRTLCPVVLLASRVVAHAPFISEALDGECSIYLDSAKQCKPISPESFIDETKTRVAVRTRDNARGPRSPDVEVLADLIDTMEVMQSAYFAPWLGTWPEAIDWTAAVMGTHISGATRSVSEGLVFLSTEDDEIRWRLAANLVDKYFTQLTSYYFGQDAFAIRNEAYDDILWVVLGWLETLQLINTHTRLHYSPEPHDGDHIHPDSEKLAFYSEKVTLLSNQTYHGNLWIPAYAHRARVFWDLATHGWDTQLCNGGMVWNPRLLPYKNAITNELFIAASISMYLHFPGDHNQSPFINTVDKTDSNFTHYGVDIEPRDARYLKAAVEGYRWLTGSNMTNQEGLFTDGFHISGYADKSSNNTQCDLRNEVVLSYNQGVLLTGQRGLWEATGALSYLADGHRLIQGVIKATGYDLASDAPTDDLSELGAGEVPRWRGLGRLGVMEDPCDASGTCSQDGQTFKGIFFHHLTAFCAPLTSPQPQPEAGLSSVDVDVDVAAFAAARRSHGEACGAYAGWLEHNAHAAMGTRDADGKFGQWWTAGLLTSNWTGSWPTTADDGGGATGPAPGVVVDYRNYGVPNDTTWRRDFLPPPPLSSAGPAPQPSQAAAAPILAPPPQQDGGQKPLVLQGETTTTTATFPGGGRGGRRPAEAEAEAEAEREDPSDPNTRGRGRTVETQGGGLALLRAYWKIAHAP